MSEKRSHFEDSQRLAIESDELSILDHDIGRYHIMEFLGRGGQGLAYRAEYEGVSFVIKFLSARFENDPDSEKKLRRQDEIVQKIKQLNSTARISKIVERGKWNRHHYIVMEFANGRALSKILQSDGWLDAERAARIAYQIIQTIRVTHQCEIIHRDLKPSNIIIESGEGSEIITIIDWGSAYLKEAGNDDRTSPGQGTGLYRSPESLSPTHIPMPSGDIFSFGVTFFESLTGKKLQNWAYPTTAEKFQNLLPFNGLEQPIPPLLKGLISKCLAYDPQHRPDAKECAKIIQEFLRNAYTERTGSQQIKIPEQRSSRQIKFWRNFLGVSFASFVIGAISILIVSREGCRATKIQIADLSVALDMSRPHDLAHASRDLSIVDLTSSPRTPTVDLSHPPDMSTAPVYGRWCAKLGHLNVDGVNGNTMRGYGVWSDSSKLVVIAAMHVTGDDNGSPEGGGAVLYSTDRGKSFKFWRTDNLRMQSVYGRPTADKEFDIFAVGSSGRIYKSNSRQLNWRKLTTGFEGSLELNSVWGNEKVVYVVGDDGVILVSLDGETWHPAYDSSKKPKPTLRSVWGIDERDVWIVGRDGLVLRAQGELTADGRRDWHPIKSIQFQHNDDFNYISGSLDGKLVLIVGKTQKNIGLVLSSTDGGLSWTRTEKAANHRGVVLMNNLEFIIVGDSDSDTASASSLSLESKPVDLTAIRTQPESVRQRLRGVVQLGSNEAMAVGDNNIRLKLTTCEGAGQ